MQKNAKKHIKSKEKRPKAIDSSHNACRYGYPFFLSPSDDDAMLEIPNPTPSVHQTPGCCCWPGHGQVMVMSHDSGTDPMIYVYVYDDGFTNPLVAKWNS